MAGEDRLPWAFVLVFFIITAGISYYAWKRNMRSLEENYNELLEEMCLLRLMEITGRNVSGTPVEMMLNLDETLGVSQRKWKIWRVRPMRFSGPERKLSSIGIGFFSVWSTDFMACGYIGEGNIHLGSPEEYDCGTRILIASSSDRWFNITEYYGSVYVVELSRGPGIRAGIISEGCSEINTFSG